MTNQAGGDITRIEGIPDMLEHDPNAAIKIRILEEALAEAAFEGWSWPVIRLCAVKAGYGEDMADAVFPDRLQTVFAFLSRYLDAKMLESLPDMPPSDMRIRDRIFEAVQSRLSCMMPHSEALRQATVKASATKHFSQLPSTLYKTSDFIWKWAGDTSKDYNRYTKRILLSGVLGSTYLYWLNDNSDGKTETAAFLDRQIERTLSLGRLTSRPISSLAKGREQAGQIIPFVKNLRNKER